MESPFKSATWRITWASLFQNRFLEAISFLVSHELGAGAVISILRRENGTGYPVPGGCFGLSLHMPGLSEVRFLDRATNIRYTS
jgi:hypothetical protein